MPIIQLIYANAYEDERLQYLAEEKAAINKHLWAWQHDKNASNHLYQDESTELNVFLDKLGKIEMQQQLIVLGFSGHAYDDKLVFNDDHARGAIIAQLLAHCPSLKLIILNGCGTVGHLQHLEAANFPLIITTTSSVGDERAKVFADALFQQLSQGYAIKKAFDWACQRVNAGMKIEKIDSRIRGGLDIEEEVDEEVSLWQLVYKNERDLDWCLTTKKDITFSTNDFTVLEQQGLKRAVELTLKKINRTSEALAIEDDPGRQIKYETQLETWENDLKALKTKAGL